MRCLNGAAPARASLALNAACSCRELPIVASGVQTAELSSVLRLESNLRAAIKTFFGCLGSPLRRYAAEKVLQRRQHNVHDLLPIAENRIPGSFCLSRSAVSHILPRRAGLVGSPGHRQEGAGKSFDLMVGQSLPVSRFEKVLVQMLSTKAVNRSSLSSLSFQLC